MQMSHATIAHRRAHTHHPVQAALGTLARAWHQYSKWSARRRSRAQLLSLGDHELQDIGISRAQAMFEHDKPFWRG
jgi:uncharacterized protein YjiS (DUF1127 family)